MIIAGYSLPFIGVLIEFKLQELKKREGRIEGGPEGGAQAPYRRLASDKPSPKKKER